MARHPTVRQFLVQFLALRYRRSQKEIAAAMKVSSARLSVLLGRDKDLRDSDFEKMLSAIGAPPVAVPIVTACIEALDALAADDGLTAEEKDVREESILAMSRLIRESLTRAFLLTREGRPGDYPSAAQARLDREWAETFWKRLKEVPEAVREDVVRAAREFQTWAFCEKVCAESVVEASRDVDRAMRLAGLAREIAEHLSGPESWRSRVQGYATAHGANALRVKGDLVGAENTFTLAKQFWQQGADPHSLLDPGRLLDLEASLRRDQRRFPEALALLDEAFSVGRSPARVLIKQGFTLEVMGDHERAIEKLCDAIPLVERDGDRRLMNILYCNLALAYCQAGRFADAAPIAHSVQELAAEMGDELGALRGLWLRGRVAAGTGHFQEALSLLGQARRQFAARGMEYDVALALLEEVALKLEEAKLADVEALARELAHVFRSKGVHREALAALRLFQKAAERREATAEFARKVLTFLFRARHDRGLQFTP